MKTSGRKPKPILTIAIDAGAISEQNPKNLGGVATVVTSLIRSLSKIDNRNKYLLYSFAQLPKDLLKELGPQMKSQVLPRIGYNKLWLTLALRIRMPDVFLATSQAMPKTHIPTLGFIYDLAFQKYKEDYPNYKRLKNNTDFLVTKSAHVITTSEASKNDIEKNYGLNDKKISVCYPGVESIFKAQGSKYVDTKPYFLYVGALKKTKNIPRLLEGYFQFIKKTNANYQLVLVGSDAGFDSEIKKTLDLLRLEKWVKYKGYAKRTDLPKFYRGAVAFISPALYEGFGLPLLEAMACATPVIAANNSSMPEVVEKAGILINEEKTEDLAKAIELMTNEVKRRKYQKLALIQSKKFSEKKFAIAVVETIYSVIASQT